MTIKPKPLRIQHPYIVTLSGVHAGPPGVFHPKDVRLADIIPALAKICRYNGHLDRYYSVAEHSVLVSRMAEEAGEEDEVIRAALFHDAHEAYTGDRPSPQKDMIAGWREFESAYEDAVRAALGLPEPADPIWFKVRVLDQEIRHREVRNLRTTLPKWYDATVCRAIPSTIQPVGLSPELAEAFFRQRMHDLGWGLGGTV